MTKGTKYELLQGYEVLQPRSGQAYPIPCDEWAIIKEKVSKMTVEPWFFRTVGSLLLGGALSTFVSILTGRWNSPDQQQAHVIAWAVTITMLISGLLCLYFSHKERAIQRERANDLIAQMDLIERRYVESPTWADSLSHSIAGQALSKEDIAALRKEAVNTAWTEWNKKSDSE